MRILFAGQIPKDLAYPMEIEDSLSISMAAERVAVSDGASESFDSKAWAKLLVEKYIEEPRLGGEWIQNRVDEYRRAFDLGTLSWSKLAAFERGSFATLLGLQEQSESNSVEIFAIGDTLAALYDGVEVLETFPYTRANQFDQHPKLLSTIYLLNTDFESDNSLSQCHKTWSAIEKRNPAILLMTDALAQWALRSAENGESAWERLIGITELSTLESLVLEEREAKKMRVDDVTLVNLSFVECESNVLSKD